MLSVAKLSRGRQGYYLATVAAGREGQGGLVEPDGQWLGRGAEMLGLCGTVEAGPLGHVLAGVHPSSGEVLSERHERVRVAAYDCTCSTPKSVSLLHALGAEDVRAQVRAGHEQAAQAALGYLEGRGARVRRRLRRGEPASSVPAAGFVAAAFLHRTSRAPDPHLHTHVLVANLASGPDGRWSALDGRGLYLELAAARDLYETQLRCELTVRLGVSWRELQGAWADLDGIDPKVNRAFSRRSAEIAAALERSGRSGPRAGRIASATTRPDKDLETPYELLVKEWRERSYRLGVSEARLAAVTGVPGVASAGDDLGTRGGTSVVGGLLPSSEQDSLEAWARRELGANGVLARDGTCRRSDLVRSRCASLRSGASVADIESDVDALVAAGRVLAVPGDSRAAGRVLKSASGRPFPAGIEETLYTTPEVLALGQRLAELARANPGRLELCAYPRSGRLEALDNLSAIQSETNDPVRAVSPGRASAVGFEAATGIETTPVGAILAGPGSLPAPKRGVLVLAEAHRLGPWELASLIEAGLGAGGRVILSAPAASLTARFGTLSVLAPELSAFVAPVGTRAADGPVLSAREQQEFCFAGRLVKVVTGARSARRALVEIWREERAAGGRALVVASDQAVVAALRETLGQAGGSHDDVVEPRHLADHLAVRGTTSRIAVLGPLPSGAGRARAPDSVHVTIVPPSCSEQERTARAAEVARPRYLLAELGKLSSEPVARARWRAGAGAVEDFRRRWSIDDPAQALGDRVSLRTVGLGAVADAAGTRLKIRQALRSVETGPVPPGRRDLRPGGLSR